MKKLDNEMQKTDNLLYSMMPKTVADRLRCGDIAVNTCEVCSRHQTSVTNKAPVKRIQHFTE